jgi:hypothetical protein
LRPGLPGETEKFWALVVFLAVGADVSPGVLGLPRHHFDLRQPRSMARSGLWHLLAAVLLEGLKAHQRAFEIGLWA